MRAISLLGLLLVAVGCGGEDGSPEDPALLAPAPETHAVPVAGPERASAPVAGLVIEDVVATAASSDRLAWTFVASLRQAHGPSPAFTWDFAGQGTSSQPAPTFTFARPGRYPVMLTVRAGGAFASGVVEVNAGDRPVRP